MQDPQEESEDVFFDSFDYISTSFSSASYDNDPAENSELEFGNLDCEIWLRELRSIRERRESFLHRMGFDDLVPSEFDCSQGFGQGCCSDSLRSDGLEETHDTILDSSNCDSRKEGDHPCMVVQDRGKIFVTHELGPDCLSSITLRQVESGRLTGGNELEMSLGLSHSVQQLARKETSEEKPDLEKKPDGGTPRRKKNLKSWWKGFLTKRQSGELRECRESVQTADGHKSERTRMQCLGKRYMEFTAVFMDQEFQAHKGAILAMKFSPDGRYLATGGEDSVVRVWRVVEVETSFEHLIGGCVPRFVDKVKECKLTIKNRYSHSAPLAIPKKTFKLEETPLHEFHGHTSDVLDLSWSKSNCLLTSSKDKTVRMWEVGYDHCRKVFRHNNYVTCIQFNPVDDGYFISGSIDGKVRIWRISENRVVDWVHIRDIITAVCYHPDGQSFLVGSISGSCRFYHLSGNSLQLDAELNIQGKKKGTGKRITGFQFTPEDPENIMITSADSKVRIVNGANVTHKYGGLRKSKNQLSASFTSDGRHIVSVGEDSCVYIWNYSGSWSSKGMRSVHSCEYFSSKDVSIAVPWPGTDKMEANPENNSPHLLTLNVLESSPFVRDAERFSLGAWFFPDCPSRSSATWPEENFSPWAGAEGAVGSHLHGAHNYHQHDLKHLSPATWSRVIVTAGHDGTIRSFHNYGLPVRL